LIGNTALIATSAPTVSIVSSLLRRKYGIEEEDRVQFVRVDGAILMIPVKNLSEMHGMFRERAKDVI
jgi:bifunctional DNA-binding transcriptional regulator/antitoxin component of YhaV-PrlF toxin-antitoxin module